MIKLPFKLPTFKLPKREDKLTDALIRKKKKKKPYMPLHRRFRYYLLKAGVEIPTGTFLRYIIIICSIISVIISVYLISRVYKDIPLNILYLILPFFLYFIFAFPVVFFLCWLVLYFYLDLRIYQRQQEIEAVLADFLQLTSANIRAGMTIDKALWFAVKPRFGILAKEIESVAKETMSGTSLEDALMRFSDKYDSIMVKRSIMLLMEGLNSGSEIGDLLNRIASNIQETRLLKREMAASVTTYAIFISFSTIAAAPFLFALSEQLLAVTTKILASVNITQSVGAGIKFSNKVGITAGDFRLFTILSLTVTSMFSGMIIAIIRRGNIKAGIRYIPFFIATTITLFLLESYFLGKFFRGMV